MSIRLKVNIVVRERIGIQALDNASNIDKSDQYLPLTDALTDDFGGNRSTRDFLDKVVYPAEKGLYRYSDPTQRDWAGNCSEIWIRDGEVKIAHQYLLEFNEEEGGTPIVITLPQFRRALEGMCVFWDMYEEARGDPEKQKKLTYTIELGE
ncbi:MAG: hypothetical protein GY820_24040 [Gammaproteobacteria bacterium]|nr:hypothetical protein [Gammaproteobacteria bacterium]